jgi:hypothetical protein
MKKTLLSIALLGAAFTASSQTMVFSDNFNSYAPGNLSSDFTGTTPGLGNWVTYAAAGGDNAATQIVNVATDDNALQFTGANGPTASPSVTRWIYNDLTAGWATRKVGQDVVQLDYNFNTGAATTSKNAFSTFFYDNAGTRLFGFGFNAETKTIVGLGYYEFPPVAPATTSTFGLAQWNIGWDNTTSAPIPLVLTADEWVHVSALYSTTTGKIRFVVYHGANMETLDYAGSTSTALIGKIPVELDFYVTAGASNAASATIKIDDIEVRAQSCFNPEVAEFSYEDDVVCIGAPSLAAVQLDAAVTGTYTSTTGLVINATTGEINLGSSTAGDYDITFTSNAVNYDATASSGCSEVHTQSITLVGCAGIEEVSSANFTVYPNPANDVVTVSLSDNNQNGTIVLTSADGKVIETRNYVNSLSQSFDVKGLTSGVYFFQVGNTTEKVIIK